MSYDRRQITAPRVACSTCRLSFFATDGHQPDWICAPCRRRPEVLLKAAVRRLWREEPWRLIGTKDDIAAQLEAEVPSAPWIRLTAGFLAAPDVQASLWTKCGASDSVN